MLPRYCGHLAAPLSSLVEAEWIWDGEEVINLHIGDMSAERRRKRKNPKSLTKEPLTAEQKKKDLTYVQFVSPGCKFNLLNTSQH